MSGPDADGGARRRAVSDLVLRRLAELWDAATEGRETPGIGLGAVGSVGRGDASPASARRARSTASSSRRPVVATWRPRPQRTFSL